MRGKNLMIMSGIGLTLFLGASAVFSFFTGSHKSCPDETQKIMEHDVSNIRITRYTVENLPTPYESGSRVLVRYWAVFPKSELNDSLADWSIGVPSLGSVYGVYRPGTKDTGPFEAGEEYEFAVEFDNADSEKRDAEDKASKGSSLHGDVRIHFNRNGNRSSVFGYCGTQRMIPLPVEQASKK